MSTYNLSLSHSPHNKIVMCCAERSIIIRKLVRAQTVTKLPHIRKDTPLHSQWLRKCSSQNVDVDFFAAETPVSITMHSARVGIQLTNADFVIRLAVVLFVLNPQPIAATSSMYHRLQREMFMTICSIGLKT